MEECSGYVGLDVHQETIAVAVAYPGRSKPESLGVIANTKKSILKLVHRLSPGGEAVGFCYEAGPCGYEVHRHTDRVDTRFTVVKETGHDCVVVAPSMIPKKPGERVKTARSAGTSSANPSELRGARSRALKRTQTSRAIAPPPSHPAVRARAGHLRIPFAPSLGLG